MEATQAHKMFKELQRAVKLTITYHGQGERRCFTNTAVIYTMLFANEFAGLMYPILEMVKNIHDHADGKGTLILHRISPLEIMFDISDEGTESYNYDTYLKGPSRLQGNGINKGVGLRSISSFLATQHFKEVLIETSHGFHYKGTYILGAMRELIKSDIVMMSGMMEDGPWEITYS